MVISIKTALRNAVDRMAESDIDSPRLSAIQLFEKAFSIQYRSAGYYQTENEPAGENELMLLDSMLERRVNGEPLQYILGEWEFFGLPFIVGEGVLIPRQDTETLVEQILNICHSNGLTSPRIADLCSGSGCIAITLKKNLPDAEIYAVELSEKAVPYLRKNAELNSSDIHIINENVLVETTACLLQNLDIVVCNPPYLTEDDMNCLQTEVTFEPPLALFGGTDGLDFYRRITEVWKGSLKDNGFLAYEFGLDQHDAVSSILRDNGFNNIQLSRDTAGIIRTAAAQKKSEECNNG